MFEYLDEIRRWISFLSAGGIIGYSVWSLSHKDSLLLFVRVSKSDSTCSKISFGICRPICVASFFPDLLRCRKGKFLEKQHVDHGQSPYIDSVHAPTRILRELTAVSSNINPPRRHKHVSWRSSILIEHNLRQPAFT